VLNDPNEPHARRGMRPNDIADVRQVEDPRVAPDGSLVAFVVSDVEMEGNRYRRRVFLASVSGGAPPRPFTTGPLDTSPRWSPDGLVLAFVAGEEDGPSDLCVLPVRRGGERIVVARLAERPSELEWSPDGTELAFVVRDPDPEHYGEVGEKREPRDVPARRITRFYSRLNGEDFVVDRPKRLMVVAADGSGAPRRLTDGPFQAGDLAWSPDATRLAFCSGRHDTWDFDAAVDVFVIPSDGSAAAERLTETVGSYSSLSWSPDGGRIAYLVDPTPMESPRHERLGVLALGDRSRTDVTGGIDRNLRPYGSSRPPVWAGERILCQVEDAGNVHVYAFGADGNGKPEPVVEGARWVGTFDAAGGTLAAAVTSPASFPELVVWALAADATATDEQRLTDVSGEFAARVRLVEPQPFVAPSRDGTDVPCWAMPPVGVETGRRYPTLLNVHGGPFTSFGNRFFDEFQMQTAAGFGVLYCNPRGSSGYSEAWGRAVRWPGARNDPGSGWGGVDYEDVLACVDEAVRRFDWVDPDRLGVLGGSYGGYMASWVVGHTDRFKAACSERACNNLLTLETSSDIATGFRGYVDRTHLEDPGAYLAHSPISFVGEMRAPVLILHSEDDLRCPINQAEELFVALRLLGREPVLVRFPGENHELSRSGTPRHRAERAEIILDWFRFHLVGADS